MIMIVLKKNLKKIVLPGVYHFENGEKLIFMIYWGEGFRSENSDILLKLYGKYK